MKRSLTAIGLGLAIGIASPAWAESAREILDRAKAINDAREPKDVAQHLRMVLVDARGNERVREIETRVKTVAQNERKTITFFLSPPEVKGVGFLSFAHPDRDDDQWLYLPAMKRVRRITSNVRTQSFQGSDFTYQDLDLFEDIPDWTESDAKSTLVKAKDTIDGVDCAVIELIPQGKDLAYGKLVIWLQPTEATIRRMELHDAKDGALWKTMSLSEFTTIDGIPTPKLLVMSNEKKGTKTRMELSEVRYNRGIPDDLFTERQLERGKIGEHGE